MDWTGGDSEGRSVGALFERVLQRLTVFGRILERIVVLCLGVY